MILAIISWILFGLVVGFIAKLIMPEPDGGGLFTTTLLGIGGAVVGGLLAKIFGYGINEIDGPGFIMSLLLAIVGSILLLAIYRLGIGKTLLYR